MEQQEISRGELQSVMLNAAAQVIFLNFNGALTSFNGDEFTVNEVKMEPAGFSNDEIAEVVSLLNRLFSKNNVIFSAERPENGEYSTIHIGSSGSFEQYGNFSGLAESIDYGNHDRSDNAFVLLSGSESAASAAASIARETGNLLGIPEYSAEEIMQAQYHTIYAGQTRSGIVLNPTDTAYVNSGGMAVNFTVSSGALLRVSSGGSATGIKLLYGGEALPQGQIVDGADTKTIIQGTNASGAFLYSGGIASGFLLNTSRELNVKNGGSAINTIVEVGPAIGKLKVSSGGYAENTTVDAAYLMILGGTANSTTITNGAHIYVDSHGAVSNTIVSGSDTYLYVSSTGRTYDTILRGGSTFVSHGGIATGVTASSGSLIGIYGGSAASTTVSSGAMMEVSLQGMNEVFSSAIVRDTEVFSGGDVQIKVGTKHTGKAIIHEGASFCINSGSILEFDLRSYTAKTSEVLVSNIALAQGNGALMLITVSAQQEDGTYILADGAKDEQRTFTVSNGTTTYGTLTVNSSFNYKSKYYSLTDNDGVLYFSISVTQPQLFNVVKLYSNKQFVKSAAVMDKETVQIGGNDAMYVSTGGIATNTTVKNGGRIYIYTNGNISATKVGYDGRVDVFEGGTATGDTVSSGGWFHISSGGCAKNLNVLSGGYAAVSSGAALSDAVLNDRVDVYEQASAVGVSVNSNGGLFVSQAGTVRSSIINSGGNLEVRDGGLAINTTVNANGLLHISSGGNVQGVVNNGNVSVYEGGAVRSAEINQSGQLFIGSDASASDTVINQGGSAHLYAGGIMSGTTVNRDGFLNISSGGTVNSVTVMSGGSVAVSSGGTATAIAAQTGAKLNIIVTSDTRMQGTYNGSAFDMKDAAIANYAVNGGSIIVYQGGAATNITVNGSGSMYISSGAAANGTVVNSGGSLYIYNGARADATEISATGLMAVFSGGIARDNTVSSGGGLHIHSAGSAQNVKLLSGGYAAASQGATVTGITINARMDVYNQATAEDASVLAGGALYISSGAAANGTLVRDGGNLIVRTGGAADNTTVASNGYIHISSGGAANGITNSLGVVTVSNGGTVSGANITSGRFFLSSGAKAAGTVLNAGASANVYINAVLSNTTVNNGGGLFIANGGRADGVTVSSGAFLQVSSGGTATGVNLLYGGDALPYLAIDGADTQTVIMGTNASGAFSFSNGIASNFLVNTEREFIVKNGGKAVGTIVNKGVAGGMMKVSSGGSAENTRLGNGGRLELRSGGIADNTSITAGGTFAIYEGVAEKVSNNKGTINAYIGGTVSSASLYLGTMHIFKGAQAVDTVVDLGGSAFVSSGGILQNTTANSAGFIFVKTGGSASGNTVNQGGKLHVSAGGTAENVTIKTNGWLNMYGGKAINVTNTSGYIIASSGAILSSTTMSLGQLQVSKGARAFDTVVNIGGSAQVYTGGTLQNNTVNSKGFIFVRSEAVATNNTVNLGGKLYAYDGGVASNTTISSGGYLHLYGGTANGVVNNGGFLFGYYNGRERSLFSSTTLNSKALMQVSSGADARNTVVNAGASACVYIGASLQDTTVNSGGTVLVRDYSTASNTTVNAGGKFNVYNSGVASDTTINGTTIGVYGGILRGVKNNRGTIQLVSGGVASNASMYIGLIHVSSGAKAYGTSVGFGGSAYGHNGGLLEDTHILSKGFLFLKSGAKAVGTVVSGLGKVNVSAGAVAQNTTLKPNGYLYVSGGTATQVNNNSGYVFAYSGAMLSSTTMSFGQLQVSNGAKATDTVVNIGGSAQVFTGGTLLNTTANFKGFIFVRSESVATNNTVNLGGKLYVYDGGVASNNTIASGGYLHLYGGTAKGVVNNGGYIFGYYNGTEISVLSSATINNKGLVQMSRGSIASDTVINSGGSALVFASAAVYDTTVNKGGMLQVKSGAEAFGLTVAGGSVSLAECKVGGKMTITSGGRINTASCQIDFSVNRHHVGDAALLNDYSAVTVASTVKFSVTVAAGNQMTGTYKLANNVSSFNKTVSIVNGAGINYGTISNGSGKVTYGDRAYTLSLVDNVLTMKVDFVTPASELWCIAKGDFDGNDTLSGIFTDGTSLYENPLSGTPDKSDRIGELAAGWEIAGVADYDKNGIDDLMLRFDDGSVEYWGVGTGDKWEALSMSKTKEGMLA